MIRFGGHYDLLCFALFCFVSFDKKTWDMTLGRAEICVNPPCDLYHGPMRPDPIFQGARSFDAAFLPKRHISKAWREGY